MQYKGTIVAIGGNEDKGMGGSEMYTQDFIADGILSRLVKEAGGLDKPIVVITSASSIPIEVGENYIHAFDKIGCHNVEVIDIRSKDEANHKANLQIIEKANVVMFGGGDQSNIANFIGGTIMHKLMFDKLKQQEDFVLAGTSAGAMCMSEQMIAGGNVADALLKGSVKMREGMSFLPALIIDSHFIQRGRFGRLAEAVARFPDHIGIGLAEDTGFLIKQGNEAKVIGSGMVIVFDPSQLTHNRAEVLVPGTPMSMSNLVVHVLANGDKYNIAKRETEILALDAPFVF